MSWQLEIEKRDQILYFPAMKSRTWVIVATILLLVLFFSADVGAAKAKKSNTPIRENTPSAEFFEKQLNDAMARGAELRDDKKEIANKRFFLTMLVIATSSLFFYYVYVQFTSVDDDAAEFEEEASLKSLFDKQEVTWEKPEVLPPDLLKDFTAAELARFDGIQSSKIYIALDGIVFDCSQGSDFYELGQGYHCLAGRDGSKVCGYMNMKAETTDVDISDITPQQRKVLDDWIKRFKERYTIMGRLLPRLRTGKKLDKAVDIPASMSVAADKAKGGEARDIEESLEPKKDK